MSRAGRGRPGRRPRDMRARADEMAALLDEAAPRAARTRRRRATALPAAVAAFGALSVGGVGLALGLAPTGAEGVLPASPSPAVADPASGLPVTSPDGASSSTPTEAGLDPAAAGADLVRSDDHGASAGSGPAPPAAGPGGRPAAPSTTRAPRPTATRPSATSTRPRATSSRPAPTSSRAGTPRSTRSGTRTSSATPVAQRAALPARTVGAGGSER